MSKILKNQTVAAIFISDVGILVPASPATYTIPPQDYLLWAASSDIVAPVGVVDIIVNDGSVDLSPSDGMDLIKGLFPSSVGVLGGTDGTQIGNVGDRLKVDVGEPVSVDDNGGSLTIDATTLPLPTGAATSANQTTEISSLSSIDGKLTTTNASLATIDAGIPASLGQTTMSASMPVTFASDQSDLSIDDGGNSITVDAIDLDIRDLVFATDKVDVGGSQLPLPTGAATSANQATEISSLSSIDGKLTTTNASLSTIDAGIPASLGQTTMSASMPIVLASDQTDIAIKDGGNSITVDFLATQQVQIDGATDNTNIGNTGSRLHTEATLKGNSDGTLIGNTGDRLKVEAIINQTPGLGLLYIIGNAVNGANENMDVNGSVTPVNFVISVPAGEVYYLDNISFLIIDVGSTGPTNYGGLAGLTNGCQLIFDIGGTEYVVHNFKNNKDITLVFQGGAGSSSASTWLDSQDSYYGNLDLKSQVTLVGDDGDQIIFRVRDNLTGLDAHNLTARFWREP